MINDVLELCELESSRRKGLPFTVMKAYGVDMFPQTRHFEGVIVLERPYADLQ